MSSQSADIWGLYSNRHGYVLGFHGCSKETAEAVISGNQPCLPQANNDYDWLGTGFYFWENNPHRAMEWAKAHHSSNPAVIGAVIDLKMCLDLTDSVCLSEVKDAYKLLISAAKKAKKSLPKNRVKNPGDSNTLLRNLDCLVINSVNQHRKSKDMPVYDSARAVFFEGSKLYPGAGIRDKNHIQICVKTPACIKGYFRPISESSLKNLVSLSVVRNSYEQGRKKKTKIASFVRSGLSKEEIESELNKLIIDDVLKQPPEDLIRYEYEAFCQELQ